MTPKAGAMAAPAITVSNEIDRMVKVSFFCFIINTLNLWSPQLYQAAEIFGYPDKKQATYNFCGTKLQKNLNEF